jgi:hypothetical protein
MNEKRKKQNEQKLAENIHDIIDEFMMDYGVKITNVKFSINIDDTDTRAVYEIETDMK